MQYPEKWNGRTAFTEANSGSRSPKAGDAGSNSLLLQRRAHYVLDRLEQQRRSGLIVEAVADIDVPDGQAAVREAADELVLHMRLGRVHRQQVEEEQRADINRLTGWTVVSPGRAPEAANRIEALRYRIAVRSRALESFAKFELATLLSTTARPGRRTEVTAPMRPWRPGV